MLAISQDMTPDPRAMIASYQALDSISELIRRGTVAERRACLDQFLEGDGVAVCLNVRTFSLRLWHGCSMLKCCNH